MFLLILDSLGTTEFLFILIVALIFFGPRKLPQISRQIGKSLAEFRKASEDFKRTWEREVALETAQAEADVDRSMLPRENSITNATVERNQPIGGTAVAAGEFETVVGSQPVSIASDPDAVANNPVATEPETPYSEPTGKRDWL